MLPNHPKTIIVGFSHCRCVSIFVSLFAHISQVVTAKEENKHKKKTQTPERVS